MATKMQFRRDTYENWVSNNPILSEGEFGLDLTHGRFKIGDGVTAWNDIDYSQYTNKAETELFNTSILANSWVGTEAPYTQTITLFGVLNTDSAIIDLTYTDDYETDLNISKEWSKIYRVTTEIDSITCYAVSKPLVTLPINVKVIR